jgi:hypothetical protein
MEKAPSVSSETLRPEELSLGIYVGYCLALSQRGWYFLSKAFLWRKAVDLLKILAGIILGGGIGLGLSYLTRGIGSA